MLGKIFKRTLIIFSMRISCYTGFLLFTTIPHNQVFFRTIFPYPYIGCTATDCACILYRFLLIYYFKPGTVISISISILLLYWALMMMGGDAPDPLAMTGNLGYKIDMWLMGPNHMYHGEGVAFDPEGLLSTLPISCQCNFWIYGRKIHSEKRKNF